MENTGRKYVHASTFGNVATSAQKSETRGDVIEFNGSTAKGILNIFSAIFDGRFNEVCDWISNPNFSTVKANEFHGVAVEAKNLGLPVGRMGDPGPLGEEGGNFVAGGFKFQTQYGCWGAETIVTNLSDKSDESVIVGQTANDIYKSLQMISSMNPDLVYPR